MKSVQKRAHLYCCQYFGVQLFAQQPCFFLIFGSRTDSLYSLSRSSITFSRDFSRTDRARAIKSCSYRNKKRNVIPKRMAYMYGSYIRDVELSTGAAFKVRQAFWVCVASSLLSGHLPSLCRHITLIRTQNYWAASLCTLHCPHQITTRSGYFTTYSHLPHEHLEATMANHGKTPYSSRQMLKRSPGWVVSIR